MKNNIKNTPPHRISKKLRLKLKGDSNKALKNLGWKSETTLEDLISEMIDFDKKEALKDSLLKRKGFQVNVNKE